MKKILVLVSVLLMLLLVACGGDTKDSDSKKDSDSDKKEGTNAQAEIDDAFDEELDPDIDPATLTELDIFSNVEVKFQGWSGFGKDGAIVTDNCDELIRENVRFSFASEYTDMSNGDMVTITAKCNRNALAEEGYKVTNDTRDFIVKDLGCVVSSYGNMTKFYTYHDGVAWIRAEFGDDVRWHCCDKTGKILFSLEPESNPTTNFANGVAIVDYNKIVDKTGKTVWSTEVDGATYATEKWGKDNVKSIKINNSYTNDYFGYSLVIFEVDSFDMTAKFTGILDNTGKWCVEPAIREYSYEGEGIYEYYIPYDYGFADEGEYYWYNLLTKQTGTKENLEAWKNTYFFNQHNGLMYKWDDETDTGAFVDATGKKVIDLSKYKLRYSDKVFNEGYVFLEIENDQGSDYYTILDTTGKEMFAPKKLTSHGALRCGFYWVNDVGYMNAKGETPFALKLSYGYDFSEDMALVQTEDNSLHYINAKGEIVF